MLLKFGAVLSIICGFLMVIYNWIHLQQCVVVVRPFLRMLKLRKLADLGLNLHRNIPLSIVMTLSSSSALRKTNKTFSFYDLYE